MGSSWTFCPGAWCGPPVIGNAEAFGAAEPAGAIGPVPAQIAPDLVVQAAWKALANGDRASARYLATMAIASAMALLERLKGDE